MHTCFFVGHRDAPIQLRSCLIAEVERCISRCGVSHFVVGGYGAFDAMAAYAVKQAKQLHPEITLQLLLPYHPSERKVNPTKGFDGTLYLFEKAVPRRYAIVKANQQMIDLSDHLICYVNHPGNARNLLDYAKRRSGKRTIVNLADFCP